ncbi:MAG: hypothetical protein ACXVZV_16025 [Terriglobales bacterium]
MLSGMIAARLATPSGSPPPPWFFIIAFVGTWILVSFFISRTSGWSTLATIYPAQQPFFGTLIRFQAAQFRWGTNYNGCLNFGIGPEGLYLVPMLTFRAFHPPLLIPWSDISARPIKLWRLFNFVELRFVRAPDFPVRIKASLAEKLAEGSVGRLQVVPLASGKI